MIGKGPADVRRRAKFQPNLKSKEAKLAAGAHNDVVQGRIKAVLCLIESKDVGAQIIGASCALILVVAERILNPVRRAIEEETRRRARECVNMCVCE